MLHKSSNKTIICQKEYVKHEHSVPNFEVNYSKNNVTLKLDPKTTKISHISYIYIYTTY